MQVVTLEKVQRQVSLDIIIVFQRIALESKLHHDVLRLEDRARIAIVTIEA
jgi:hypothetical protein